MIDCPTWDARLDAVAVRFYSNVLAEARTSHQEGGDEAVLDAPPEAAHGAAPQVTAGERALMWLRSRPQGQLWIESLVLHIQGADLQARAHCTRNPPPPVFTSVAGRLHCTLHRLGWACSATGGNDPQQRRTASSSVWVGDHIHAHLSRAGQALTTENIVGALPAALTSASRIMDQLCNQLLGIANAASPKWSRTFRKRVSKAVYCMHRSRASTPCQ